MMNRDKSNQINLRVSADVAADLDTLAEQSHVTRIDVARQILLEGIQQRKRDRAVELCRNGKLSKSRAAELAGISMWELMDLLSTGQVANLPYTLQDAVEDVRRIVAGAA
jgi:predicted HTH domain antitoxin